MKHTFYFLGFCLFYLHAHAQVITVTLQCSRDAAIGYHDGANTANNNDGKSSHLCGAMVPAVADPQGFNCVRSLLAFDLSPLPVSASIISATLNLYALGPYKNVPGHFGMANPCYLQRVTQPWTETGVTWNNKPSVTTQNQVLLPQSSGVAQDYPNIDVTLLVQDLFSAPSGNEGFLLRLVNEAATNALYFCSRDHVDAAKRPALIVTYCYDPLSDPGSGAKRDCITGIAQNKGVEADVVIFPVPAKNTFTLRSGTAFDRIRISDLQGKMIREYLPDHAQDVYEVNNAGLAGGVYFCTLFSGSRILAVKKMTVISE